MPVNEDSKPSLWLPITDPVTLAFMGKCLEEVGELGAIVARIQIQGFDGVDPDSGVPNKHALEDEIADVLATTQLLGGHFNLDTKRIKERANMKVAYLQKWAEAIEEATK